MSGELWFLLIATVTYVFDRTIAALSVDRIQVIGFQSRQHIMDRPEQRQESGPGHSVAGDDLQSGSEDDDYKVFCFMLQNDEEVPVEWLTRPMRATIRIRGTGSFMKQQPIDFTAGPDDEARFVWKTRWKELELLIPRMRPHKTWTIRCNVANDVQEMECILDIPTNSWMRQLVERVNSAVFQSKGLEYHSQTVVVRRSEDPHLTRKLAFLKRRKWLTILPIWVAGGWAYALVNRRLISLYPPINADSLDQFIQSRLSILPAVIVLLLAFIFFYELARTEPLPIAQGYQVPKFPEPEHPVAQSGVPSSSTEAGSETEAS